MTQPNERQSAPQFRMLQSTPQFRVERADGTPPQMTGYAAIFNSLFDTGWWSESIAPGAFKKSIAKGDDVRALFNHDPSLILGRTPRTLTLTEDDKGLFCRITPPDTQLGRDLLISIERGDITQMSFGFNILGETVDKTGDKTHFTITEAELFDVSPVTYPAYTATEIGVTRGGKRDFSAELQARLARAIPTTDPRAELALRQRRVALLTLR